MPSGFDIGPYDPCPCGSGAKYKFCCAARARANRHGKFPVGTVALYGPDDKTTTKIAAAVILREDAEPAHLERWVGTAVRDDPKVAEEIRRFFALHGVKSVVVTAGNLGCPHEEGEDFPVGSDCPFCPFWRGKQGTAARDDAEDLDDDTPALLRLDPPESDRAADLDAASADEQAEGEDDLAENPFVTAEEADAVFARVEAILGDRDDLAPEDALDILFAHLRANLVLPCEVTGTEDFRWEEPYVFGGWSGKEYKRLKKTRPSYTDRYQLVSIDLELRSEWMLFHEDIAARVRRVSDGKPFVLGLAELESTDKQSPNYQLLRDYSIWFVNSR